MRYTSQDELGRLILVMAKSETSISHSDVMCRTNVHPRDVTVKLQELLKTGLLRAEGNTRAYTYFLHEPKLQPSLDVMMASSQGSPPSSQGSPPSSQGSPPSSQGSDGLPWDHLMAMAHDVRTRRRPKTVMHDTIVGLCAVAALTASELAKLVGRSKEYLQNDYLWPMISSGALMYQKPSSTDPNQRYVAP